MARLEGKVAFITGAARGQGRAHAVRFAEEGADIIALDLCAQVGSAPYPMASPDDLEETARLVEKEGRRILAREGDVRRSADIEAVVAEGLAEFGHIDVAVANAGVASTGELWTLTDDEWHDVIDINLTGVWRSVKAVVPHMIERRQGSIIVTSSAAGLVGLPRLGHYTAAKHGVTGLAKALAAELAPYRVRVNSVHPGNVDTPMINHPSAWKAFTGSDTITAEEFAAAMQANTALPLPWIEDRDVSNAMLFLASDEARYVTGTQQVVDAGNLFPLKVPHLEE